MTREMKDSTIEWVGEIPKEWKTVRVSNLFQERKAPNRLGQESNRLSLSYGNIIRKDINSGEGLLPESFNTYNIIEPNDIIIRPTDLQNDKTSLRTGLSTEHGIITSAYIALRPNSEDIDSRYFHYLLHSYDLEKVFYNMGNGVRQGLTFNLFARLLVLEPPLSVQQSIANYLDHKTSQIDELVTNIEAQIVKLDEYKKALISQAVTKGLDPNVEMKDSGVEWIGEVPKRWEIYNPKYLFKQQVARAKLGQKQLTASQKYGVISQKEFMNRENQSIVPVEKDFSILKQVVPGDFVISMRSFQGGLEYSDMEGSISSAYVMVHKTNDQVGNRYYKWLFKSSCYIDALQPTSNLIRDGQAMRFTNFQLVRIPLPPIDEQIDIAVYLDQKCHQIDSLKDSLIQQKKSLSDYKKTLIFDYVTGKKEVPTSWDKERSDE